MIEYSYKTTLPKEANSPVVIVTTGDGFLYDVYFYEINNQEKKLLSILKCRDGNSIGFNYTQTFVNWYIRVELDGVLISEDYFDPSNKVVFIKMDAYALGDNIAWIPYVEEFRKKHNCTVICSTFYNDLFKNNYKNILFVKPNTNIDNIYAQYYIGATNEGDYRYSKIKANENPLQAVAASTLGTELKEIRPILTHGLIKQPKQKKYVCISEFGSHENKFWKDKDGWQKIVDFFNSINFDIVVISKEPTNLKNIINLTGDKPLFERCQVLYNSDMFIGVSSGLSWLAWGVGVDVMIISDVTPSFHEFSCHRINFNEGLKSVNYEIDGYTKYENVLEELKKIFDKDIYK